MATLLHHLVPKLQMTIRRKQGQPHPDVRPYCCCTLTPYIVLKSTRMRRVILLLPYICTVYTGTETTLPVPGPWFWALCRRNHYIEITMREESHIHCLYRENQGEMRVGGRRLWACSFYVHPQLATPTADMEEVCCKDSHYRTRVLFSHIVFMRNCVSTELGEHMLCNITYTDVACESTNITEDEAMVPGAQVAFMGTDSSYIYSRANERGIFP
jgi:hypothetical protein